MATITTANLIKEAGEKIKQREQLVTEIASLREVLRHLRSAGQLSDSEAAWIEQAFPPRKRGEGGENGGGGE